jgi:hypothetical protein
MLCEAVEETSQMARQMGKAARNERLKINATFLNNISAGIALTGWLIPIFSFMTKNLTIPADGLAILILAVGTSLSVAAAAFLHWAALQVVSHIKD